uniref:PX domain-containing protein n=1 Tax=Peronospora matthiolae TaxID=2874970 RepID=A0AAV1VMR5_9STRA
MKPTLRYAYSRNGDYGRVDEKCLVRVQIPTVDSGAHGKVRYHVRITNVRSGQMWEVARRFSAFLQLRNDLIAFFAATDKKCPGCRNYEKVLQRFEFPRKHVFTSVTPAVINYRKKALCSFMALLASHTFTSTPKCPTCSSFPFTSVRDWLTMDTVAQKTGTAAAAQNNVVSEAIRDTMNVKDFTKYHPVTTSMSVDQEGRFVGKKGQKNTSPGASWTDQKERRRDSSGSSRHWEKQSTSRGKLIEAHVRYNGSNSSSKCTYSPPSPPSVDGFLMPTPAAIVDTHVKVDSNNGIGVDGDDGNEEEEEEFESFVVPSSALLSASGNGGESDHSARAPLTSDGDVCAGNETVRKTHFKFTRNSMWADGDRSSLHPRESSMIEIDDLDGEEEEEEEGLNMDFLDFVCTAPTLAEGSSCTL